MSQKAGKCGGDAAGSPSEAEAGQLGQTSGALNEDHARGEDAEEEEEDWFEDLVHLSSAELDLYGVLHVPNGSSFNVDRARASFHRLSYRFHPEMGRKACQTTFCNLTLAYLTLKDEERRRIYDQHGIAGLFASEQYMDPSIFETDPYKFYNDFYQGIDPADREYFLLNGTDAGHPSDSEEEENEQGENGNNDNDTGMEEDNIPRVQMSEEERTAAIQRAKALESKSMPTPPASVLVSNAAFSPKGADIFSQIAQATSKSA